MSALTSRQRHGGERGAAMVFVAVLLPMLALFVSLGVDFAHFFDYSRNLQNRADAAALAAGVEYGAKCFGTTVTSAQLDAIGHVAQQYSGPPVGTPDANLPYAYGAVSNYQNQPNLKAGTGPDLHLILNGAAAWNGGGVSFSEGTFCAANYPVPPPLSPPQPALDVWITQAHLPLFFPLVGFKPDISAHARVQLQSIGTPLSTIPVAVPDPGQVPCLYGQLLDQTTGTAVGPLTQLTKVAGSNPPIWSGFTGQVTIPGHQLTVQAVFPDNCSSPSGSNTTYDLAAQGGGIDFVNTYTTPTLPVSAPSRGSVWLTPSGCTGNAAESTAQQNTGGSAYFFYFTQSTSCQVTVNAVVDFPAAQGTPGVSAVMDGNVTGGQSMAGPTVVGGHQVWTSTFSVGPRSGRHTFSLYWFQSASPNNKCQTFNDATKNNNPCGFNGGDPLQETFSAVDDGSSPSDDSGPIVAAQVGCATGSGCPTIGGIGTDGASGGVNSIPAGSTPNLQITFKLQGLQNSGQNDPPIVLRASVQSSKKTGIIECGQGSGASQTSNAITNGCPHPLSIYDGSTCVLDPSTNPWTCVHINTGNARNQIVNGFTNRIGSSCDNWQTFKATGNNTIDASTDPRAFTMVITSPNDLSNGTTDPNAIVHILGFATFYVTGWDGDQWLPGSAQTIPGCASPTNKDEAYPGTGSPNNQIWGHFYKTAEPGGIGSGNPCDPNVFGDCVAALTR